MQIVTLASVAPQPWRNGGGNMREPWIGASAESPDDWQWRVSVAAIERNGPFSAYPGVERHFAVLQGAGVVLRFADHEQHCTVIDDALHFNGADAPHCNLIDGPTLALNLMLRGSSGTLRRAEPGKPWRSASARRAVWCGSAASLWVDGLPETPIPPAALAFTTDGADQTWHLTAATDAAAAWWIDIGESSK